MVWKPSESSSNGGFVNNAFDDDEEFPENHVTYARWINKNEFNGSEIELAVKQKNTDIVRELNDAFKSCGTKDNLDNDSEESDADTDIDIYQRPTKAVSRADIISALSSKYREGALGQVCTDINCPYNQWLYEGKQFPEYRLLKKWETELKKQFDRNNPLASPFNKPELPLDPNNLARKVWSRSTPISNNSSQRSPSFSYFQFNGSKSQALGTPPITPNSQLPLYPYNSPSTLSSSYPIVTLPRSQRKKNSTLNRASIFGNIFAKPSEVSPVFSESKPRPPSCSSSCSCSSSSLSSCSSCFDMDELPIFQYPYMHQEYKRSRRKASKYLPKCDLTCYVITSFVLLSFAGLAAVFLYFYLFADDNEKEKMKN